MKFNITKNLNAYGGRNKWSVPIGTTRNIRGSANRIYNYCDRTTNDPLYCMFQFTPPKPIKGNLIFLYDFTGTNITESIVLDNLPVKILPRVFEITPKVTITGNKVYVEIDSYLYESSSYSNDFGFTFNLQSSILTFYNSFTANLTFVKNYNFPFSRTGRQFAGLTLPFNKLSLSKPYFLPGTSLAHCFSGCTLFNQDIEYWNVSNVTSMNSMFENATAFNNGGSSTISNWSAPLCTTFAGMFHLATSFDQPLTNLVKKSYVSTTMLQMFREATAFNRNIGGWDVSKVTNMASMFESTNFNNGNSDTISNWTAPYCTDFTNMFKLATSFNQPLTKLVKTSYVSTTMLQMFQNATVFNQNIGEWDVFKVTSMLNMFELTPFNNGDLGNNGLNPLNWSAPLCTMFAGMFVSATSFNQPLTNLVKTSGVESCSMNIMFENATAFNQDIGEWDVSKVTTMSNMFYNAINFNNGSSSTISNWSAPYCTRFAGMFNSNTNSAFNQPLTNLVDTSGVTSCTMANMFQNATVFNQNIGEWDVSKVTSMAAMFQNATAFNNGSSDTIKYWEAPYCTDFTNMFYLATSFNQPLTNLVDTSGVTSCTMLNMFRDARAFNNGETGLQNIPNINPNPPGANYTNTTKILNCPGATFSSTLGVNNVLIIQTSTIVYSSAILNIASDTSLTLTTAFGSNILTGIISIQKQIPSSNLNPLNWNTSNVTSLANMFRNAIFFNQNITTNGNIWNTYKVTNLINMFFGSSSSLINLFNNGQFITGQTAPMGWNFNPTTPPTSTNYRTNCRLTASNKPTSLV